MTADPVDWVAMCLRDPTTIRGMTLRQWDFLIRQAVASDLIARIALQLAAHELVGLVPSAPRRHLDAAVTFAGNQQDGVLREIDHISKAFEGTGIRPVLLKGAAYVSGKFDAARGRMFMDVDILVPRERLGETEAALMLQGWATTHHDPYDQRYYREWMHELPPMQHMHRGTVLDAHHSILPLVGRLQIDARLLTANARAISGYQELAVLAAEDMVIHSATHLFMNEEFSHGLRDLSDLDLLLRQFGANAGFWNTLTERGRVLGLGRPLFYALRYAKVILGTPVPAHATKAIEAEGPARPLRSAMDWLWLRALRSPHRSSADAWTPVAMFLLYLRAHRLRMPPPMLILHLCVKTVRRLRRNEQPV